MNVELVASILAPLFGAMVCAVSPRQLSRVLGATAAVGTLGAACAVARQVSKLGVLVHPVGGFGAPLGITLSADGLAAVLLVVIAGVASAVTARALLDRGPLSRKAPSFFGLWLFAWAALNALVLSADIFNMYVTLELTTLGGIGLIGLAGGPPALRAALHYLLVALTGSLIYLLGVALLYGNYGTLDVALLSERVAPDGVTRLALVLTALGLCLKAGLFPLHGWLPPAYVAAHPVPAALLSGLIGKGAYVIALRLWFQVLPAAFAPDAGQLIGALGAAGVLFGSVLALRQLRLGSLIAYSSVAQVGYMFVPFSLNDRSAWAGGVMLALSHAAAKAAMFLAAGTIGRARGGDALEDLPGLARHLPVTFFALALSGVSLMGMPPSGGFVAKWLLVRAAFEQGEWWWALVILVGGLIGAGYIFRILRRAFAPPAEGARFDTVGRLEELAPLALALMALALGLFPSAALGLLAIGAPR